MHNSRVLLATAFVLGACDGELPVESRDTSLQDSTLAAASAQTPEALAAELAPLELVFSHSVLPFDAHAPEGARLDKYTFALDGIAVHGAGVRVLRDGHGRARVVSALHLGAGARATRRRPALTEQQAGKRAIDQAFARTGRVASLPPTVRHTSLAYEATVVDDARGAGQVLESLRLTYQVELLGTPEQLVADHIAVIDAESGELVAMPSTLLQDFADGQGYFEPSMVLQVEPTMTGTPPVLGACLTDLTRGDQISNASPCGPTVGSGIHTFIELPNPERVERVIDTDLHFGDGVFPFDRTFAAGEHGRTVAADAHFAVGVAYDFFRDVFNRRLLGVTDSLEIHVNSTTWPWNAAFSWPQNTIIVGTRVVNAAQCPASNPDCSVPAADVEWLGHEYVHAVLTSEISMPTTNNEWKALHEGIADIFAVLIDGWWYQAPGTAQIMPPRGWFFADRIYPGEWRQFDRPSLDNLGSLDVYDPGVPTRLANGTLGPHAAGGIVRRAFYFLAQGIAPWGPPAPPPAPNNTSALLPAGLAGVGLSKAAALLYLTVSTQFNPGDAPTFLEFREGMVRSAEYLDGRCSESYKAVQDAWGAMAVGGPADRQAPVVPVVAAGQLGSSVRVIGFVRVPASEPVPVVSLYVDGTLRQASVPVAFYQQTGAQIEYRAAAADMPFTDLGPGVHTFELRAEDGCRNVGSASTSYEYDNDPPAGLSVIDTFQWRSSLRVFRVRANDLNPYSYELKVGTLSTGPKLVSGTVHQIDTTVEMDLTSLPGGNATMALIVHDTYGHSSTLTSSYMIDRVAPGVCAMSAAPSPTDPHAIVAMLSGYDSITTHGSPIEILDIWVDGLPFWWTDRAYPPGSDHYMTRLLMLGGGTMTRTVLNASDGPHKLLGKCTDSWGNLSTGKASFVVTGPPSLTTSTSIHAGSFTISATATSAASKIDQIQFYEGATLLGTTTCGNVSTTCTASRQLTASPGQTRTIQVRAFDQEGRRTNRNVTVTIPLPPPPQILDIQRSGPAILPTLTVTTSNASEVEMSLNGTVLATDTSAPFTFPLNLSGWPTGPYNLVFKAHDGYGRTATSSFSVFADSTPPVVIATVSGTHPPYLVDVGVLENSLYSVNFMVDGATFATLYTSPYEAYYSPSSPGAHTINVVVTDAYFNSTAVDLPAPVDDTPPDVTLSFETSDGPHHVIILEDTCGIDLPAQLFLDGAPVASIPTASSEHAWPNLSHGQHTVAVNVSDKCGNATHVERQFTYINDPPEVLSVAVDSSMPKQPRLTIDATDDVAVTRIDILREGTNVGTLTAAPWIIQLDTASWSDGNHTVTVRAFDAEGQTGQHTVTIKADNTKPTYHLVPTDLGLGSILWTATATDASPLTDVTIDALLNGPPVIQHFSAPPYQRITTISPSANQVDVWVAGGATDSFGNMADVGWTIHVTCTLVNNQRVCTLGPLQPVNF